MKIVDIKNKIMRFLDKQLLYYNVVIKANKQIEGYDYIEIGTLPIADYHHYKGYEIINPKTKKVLYRRIKDYGYIGYSSYNQNNYNVVRKFFYQNKL